MSKAYYVNSGAPQLYTTNQDVTSFFKFFDKIGD